MLVNWTDILDGEIVNAAWAVAGMVAKPRTSRRAAADLDTAAWADTERLIRDALAEFATNPELPEMPEAEAARLEAALKGHEVQGALQALLAVRLTDAPETDAARARRAVQLALTTGRISSPGDWSRIQGSVPTWEFPNGPELLPRESPRPGGTPSLNLSSATPGSPSAEPTGVGHAERLSEYFDDKICALVATLEGRAGFAGLTQVRAEAYNSRIVALLGTITNMLAALSHPDRGGPEEAEFLRRYRRQVRERHGKLEPPDFERRRKVPVEKIYVNTPVREYLTRLTEFVTKRPTPDLNVMDLARLLDRTVLLGDPGGGKTTAANVLANAFASDPAGKVPFLVTLREYAANDPPDRSVAGHIEHTMETVYQCLPPDGVVERLLLTEQAIVIFDGLDELLDPSRRRDVPDLVEQFCAAYPLTPVLVTSRVVGYAQARLDDDQFTSYRLGDFDDQQVAEYAHKWFAVQEDSSTTEAGTEAQAFLTESRGAPDLRSNPLLLSLMCILYRGAGSLPRDRAEVYEQCATLLFRKWDARRRIHQELHAGHLVEPAIRHLAWWLFNRENPQTAVTERELIAKTTEFLHGRGFESEEEARAAAEEFVEFCRGRMWVLNEAGSTGDGEKLYAFTHRTFLEYFSAAYLAAATDSPEDLAHQLAARVENQGWNVVGELAIQIKDRNSDRGADRVYEALLSDTQLSSLAFLIRCLESVQPSPGTIRKLTRAVIDDLADNHVDPKKTYPVSALLTRTDGRHEVVADEISHSISAMVASDDRAIRIYGLRIVLMVRWLHDAEDNFWERWSEEQARIYASEILSEAGSDRDLAVMALNCGSVEVADAMVMLGGFSALMQTEISFTLSPNVGTLLDSYPVHLCSRLLGETDNQKAIGDLAIIGHYLLDSFDPPLVHDISHPRVGPHLDFIKHLRSAKGFPILDETTCLGFTAVVCVTDELKREDDRKAFSSTPELSTGTAFLIYRYLVRRRTGSGKCLPDLPVPVKFRQVFRDWAEGRVNFVELVEEEPNSPLGAWNGSG